MDDMRGQTQKRKVIGLTVMLCLMALVSLCCKRSDPNPPTSHTTVKMNPLQEAINKMEEARGVPVGRKAQINVPPELQHYADRHRFLQMQEAAWRERHLEIPQDYLQLLDLIDKQGLVEMEPLGADYLLYGVGENANTDVFSYTEPISGKEITLFADAEDLARGLQELANSVAELQKQIADLQVLVKQMPGSKLTLQMKGQLLDKQQQMETLAEKGSAIKAFYDDPARRLMLFTRYRLLADRAADFNGEQYDITTATDRRHFKMRLLSFIRPEARTVILQIAAIYKEKFGRHLPITSLVRTLDYQKKLREVNPNATGVEIPPHTTGLAFDVYNGWMSAEEQDFLMSIIARMKVAGRIEALRENRDHIHIFAFPNGRPPSESSLRAVFRQ
jgi:hypothetical protein